MSDILDGEVPTHTVWLGTISIKAPIEDKKKLGLLSVGRLLDNLEAYTAILSIGNTTLSI